MSFYRQPNNRFNSLSTFSFRIFLFFSTFILRFSISANMYLVLSAILSLSLSHTHTYTISLSFHLYSTPDLSHEQKGTICDDSYLFQMHSSPFLSLSFVNISCCVRLDFPHLISTTILARMMMTTNYNRMRRSVGNGLPRESSQLLRAARLWDPLGRRLSTFDAASLITFSDIPIQSFEIARVFLTENIGTRRKI